MKLMSSDHDPEIIVQRHINLLHTYNEIKDGTQSLISHVSVVVSRILPRITFCSLGHRHTCFEPCLKKVESSNGGVGLNAHQGILSSPHSTNELGTEYKLAQLKGTTIKKIHEELDLPLTG